MYMAEMFLPKQNIFIIMLTIRSQAFFLEFLSACAENEPRGSREN